MTTSDDPAFTAEARPAARTTGGIPRPRRALSIADALSAALPSCVDAESISSEIRPSSASVASTSEEKCEISLAISC
jgi:hypothetical protein